ncbi:lipopolysaccharide biosynthesis protein [Micromonospora aurantiaca (nom. illeg.)]|uniref:lipopolysaccharide biosynthesis protein n=1 Tax=Micromonospora aurantiaca (nom. illeg.) TaxID=47850 RepID=UPI003EB6A232
MDEPPPGRRGLSDRLRRAGRLPALVTTGNLVAAQLVTGAASLAINAMAARSMGPAGRGSLALLLQLTYLANMLAMAGTDRAYPATAPVGRDIRQTSADALRLVILPGAVVLLAAAPIAYALGGNGRGTGLVTVIGCMLTIGALLTAAALRTGAAAAGVTRPYLLATVTGQAALMVSAALLTLVGTGSPQTWLLAYGAALAVGPMVAWRLLRRLRPAAPPAHGLVPARRLGLRLLPAAAASLVVLRADRLLLPWLGSYEQLGLYIVVATVAEFAIWPVQNWIDVQSPRWHQRFLAGELRRTGPLLAAAGYGIVSGLLLLAAGRLLVVPVFGSEYRESTALLVPLAIATACYSVSRAAIGLGVAAGRARGALAADIPAMVVAVGAYLLLIPHYGAMGAAVGSAVAYGVGAVLALLLAARIPHGPTPDRDAPAAERSETPPSGRLTR